VGTFPNPDAAERLARTARAAVATGAETVIALGDRDIRDQRWPKEAWLANWINTPQEVAHCPVVVHHGGAGTSYAAVDASVPAVCLPQMGDQFRNAALLATARVCVTPEEATDSRLRELITRRRL
jgi:UDP:flavonoid glycosyltransferase YjiC (YdhE family)